MLRRRFVEVRIEEDFSGGIDGTGRNGSFVVATTGKFDGERATSLDYTLNPV